MAGRLSADEKKWRVQSDLETLNRAQEIQADRSRLAAVRKHAQEQVKSLSKVAGTGRTTKKGR